MVCNYLIRRGIAKYEAVYFVGDNQAINRVRVESYKTRNRGAFSGSLAALIWIQAFFKGSYSQIILEWILMIVLKLSSLGGGLCSLSALVSIYNLCGKFEVCSFSFEVALRGLKCPQTVKLCD